MDESLNEDRGLPGEPELPPLVIDEKGRVRTLPPVPLGEPLRVPDRMEEEVQTLRERLAHGGERYLAKILRAGAVASGALFATSVALRVLPVTRHTAMAIDLAQQGAVSLLLFTPVARLVASGVVLGAKGEWRYALYAAGVIGLLGLALGAGFNA